MNKQLGFAILLLAALMLVPANAVRKKNEQQTPTAAGTYVPPSTKLEPFLEPCLDAILAPLEVNPKLPRVEVEKLRSSFAGGQIKAKTPAQQQIFQNAMAVCDALNKAMDDRANTRSAAQASSKVPMRSAATGIIKSSPMRGVNAGANAEAIRKKQKDERKDADDVARSNAAYMDSAAYRLWTEKAPLLRQGVMALYTRQIQLEALDERNAEAKAAAAPQPAKKPAPAEEKPTPAVAAKPAAKPAEKGDAAKERPYLGKWKGSTPGKRGSTNYLVYEDHALVRQVEGKGEVTQGTWKLTPKGVFVIAIEGVPSSTHYKLTDDGKAMQCTSSTTRWDRVNPTEAGASAIPVMAPAPSAEKPVENGISAKKTPYAGTWGFTNGSITFLIKDDHTAVKSKKDGEKANGTWTVEDDGDFHVKWEDHLHFRGKLSEDGQSIRSSLEDNKILMRKP